ncbi:MAG TPA: right-handed parallel beta-helix repeat-containing protein [Deltaproteobacteria bacterium]|nr:right-handed parallel beta-helix repeat-containing protein [Deltaproteobacteria bacterium]
MGTTRSTIRSIMIILLMAMLVAGCRHQSSRHYGIGGEDNGGGEGVSEEVVNKPVIKTHPLSQTVPVGATAVFFVEAMDPSGVTYQWQQSADGTDWTDIPGATDSSYGLAADAHAWFRCILTNAGGSAASNAAELTAVKVRFVKLDAAGNNDGTSWTDAYTDLQSALTPVPDGERIEVWVAAGTYRPTAGYDRGASFVMKENLDLYGGFAGDEANREARDPETNKAILSGDINVQGNKTDNSYCVVRGADGSILDGFTITGAYSPFMCNSGGMVNSSSSPSVTNCIFTGNESYQGGGMSNYASSPTVTGCIFIGNKAAFGGGMYSTCSSNPAVLSCVFSGNSASNSGGGLYTANGSNTFINGSTIVGNSAEKWGGGVKTELCSATDIINSILWDNAAGCGWAQVAGMAAISYSCVQGGAAGAGNIADDPLLGADLTLQAGSPCIDAGLDGAAAGILFDLSGNPRTSGAHVDMGAFEFQE